MLANLWQAIFPKQKERAHVLKIRPREPSPELLREPRGQLLQQLRNIRRTLGSFLLVLDDAAADFEVGHHLEGVHDGGDAAAGALDELPDFGKEGGEAVWLCFGRGAGFATGGRLFS